MKKLLVVLFLFISFLGFGQSVSAPDPKSFTVNTTGQDASGFELTGFSSTETLLTSISLVNPPSGTTFYLNTTTGLTAASGFTLSGNKTKLVFTGTMASINTTLASLKVNTGLQVAAVGVSSAAQIAAILSAGKGKSSGAGGGSAQSAGGGAIPNAPTIASTPAPQIQTNGGMNPTQQIGETISASQRPIKAYVISGDVTSQQALDRRTSRAATFSAG
jgi:hypothetical protein